MNKIIIKSRRNGISILQLKLENLQLKRENLYYKAELKLTCNELDKSEKWQIFERRKKNKYHQTLQEIKAIAERKITYIDFTKSKSCAEVEQDYAQITYELEQKIFEILQKIFKAEEE